MVSAHTCDMEEVEEEKQCPVCLGKRRFKEDDYSREPDEWGNYPQIMVDCTDCEGTGSVTVTYEECTICGNRR
jgi:RecJ-like exonuclease